MNWIQKNYERALLVFSAVLALLGSGWIIFKTSSFGSRFMTDEPALRAACKVGDIDWTYLRFVRDPAEDGMEGPWRPAATTGRGRGAAAIAAAARGDAQQQDRGAGRCEQTTGKRCAGQAHALVSQNASSNSGP